MATTTKRGVKKTAKRSGPTKPKPAPPAASKPVPLAHGESVHAETPHITIEGLPPGTHTFELIVTDDLGVTSEPVRITVEVTDPNI